MTTCQEIASDLRLHHDGELDPPAERRLSAHLAGCEACRSRLEGLVFLRDELRALDAAAPGPDLWAAIAGRLPAIDAAGREDDTPWWQRLPFVPGWLRPLGAVVALATVAAVLVLVRTPPPIDVVRSVDAKGRPVMVLPSVDDATIIWVMDDGAEAPEGGDAPTGL